MTYLWPQRDLLISDFINPGVYTVLVLRFGCFYFFSHDTSEFTTTYKSSALQI